MFVQGFRVYNDNKAKQPIGSPVTQNVSSNVFYERTSEYNLETNQFNIFNTFLTRLMHAFSYNTNV